MSSQNVGPRALSRSKSKTGTTDIKLLRLNEDEEKLEGIRNMTSDEGQDPNGSLHSTEIPATFINRG